MKNLIILLPIALFVGCTAQNRYSPDYGAMTVGSRQEAMALLPDETRLKYEVWQENLTKNCSVKSAFDTSSEISDLPTGTNTGIDLRMFFDKTGNSLFLKSKESLPPKDKDGNLVADWEIPEFAIFGAPRFSEISNRTVSVVEVEKNGRQGQVNLEMKLDKGICQVYVGKYKVDTFVLVPSIPIISYSSAAKRNNLSVRLRVDGTKVITRRGNIKFSDLAVTVAGYSALSASINRFPQTPPVEYPSEPTFPINGEQLVHDFIFKMLGSIDRSQLPVHFPIQDLNILSSTSVEFVGRPNDVPFGFNGQSMMGSERQLKDLRIKKLHEFKTLWRMKPSIVKVQDPNDSQKIIGNEDVDKDYWTFEVSSTFDGSVDEGGSTSVTGFAMKTGSISPPQTSAAICFAKRANLGRLLVDSESYPNASLLPITWADATGPCMAYTNNIYQDILDAGTTPTVFAADGDSSETVDLNPMQEFRNILKEAKLERGFGFQGWDFAYKQLVNIFMDGDSQKDLSRLDPSHSVPVMVQTQLQYEELRTLFHQGGEELDRRLKEGLKDFVDLIVTASLWGFDLNQLEILPKIKAAALKTNGILEFSFKNYVQSIGQYLVPPPKDDKEPQDQWKALKLYVSKLDEISKLSDDVNEKLIEVDSLARSLGLTQWAESNIKNYLANSKEMINDTQITTWRDKLRALEVFYAAEKGRIKNQEQPLQSKYWREDFENRYLSSPWSNLSLKYLEKFSTIVDFIPECKQYPDVVSRLWCVSAYNINTSSNGMLFPESRDRLWELATELKKVLPELPADDVRSRVARQFFAPIFQLCRPEGFRAKVKNLMSFLIQYQKNPTKEKARTEFPMRLEEALRGCN